MQTASDLIFRQITRKFILPSEQFPYSPRQRVFSHVIRQMSPPRTQPMTAPDAVRLNDVSGVTLMSGHPTTVHIRHTLPRNITNSQFSCSLRSNNVNVYICLSCCH